MYTVKLLRHRNNRDEEYGRIVLDGGVIRFEGLSSIFQAYLKAGITDGQRRTYTPRDGITFLKKLKYHNFGTALCASDIQEIPRPSCHHQGPNREFT